MAARKKIIKDKFAKREAAKYPNPIPSREYIMGFLKKRGGPATRDQLIRSLGLGTEDEQEALRRRLRAMERDGQLIFTRRGGYGLVEKMGLISGRVIGHKEGYGFLRPDEGGEDLFLNAKEMRKIFDGDRVLIRIAHIDRKGRKEAALVEILERGNLQLVGRYFVEGDIGFVTPENKRISQNVIIPHNQNDSAKHGQIVTIEIVSPPTFHNQAIGRVVEKIGDHMAPGMEIDIALRMYEIPFAWKKELLNEAEKFPTEVLEKEIKDRKDFRKKAFVTIDGEDAKDFDDAVFCEKRPRGGWILYVAIADVSHYVKPNTELDQEALLRGNSVYLPRRVIPMLPEVLSNKLCSLRPNQDRLTIVCEMSLNSKGGVIRNRFYEAVIQSHARMTYTNVHKILVKKDIKLQKQYKNLHPHLEELYNLFKVLQAGRQTRGALDFETIETKVLFDEHGKIKQIVPQERNDAHKIIEECMLLANVCASKFLLKNKAPTLYRTHEGPTEEKLNDLRSFLSELGLSLPGGKKPRPKDYSKLLDSIEERKDAHLIQTVMLRSLSQAVYTPENKGHFGLAYDCYAHFTSPIRRYPDLLVHRAIRHILQGKEQTSFDYGHSDMVKFGEHCSTTERRADNATYYVIDWLKCEYMLDHIGNVYNGIITSVTGFGLFVELKDVYVEGLVHISDLKNDYYNFDAVKHRLIGERMGTTYRLADPIRVRVARVDLDSRKIDFVLAP